MTGRTQGRLAGRRSGPAFGSRPRSSWVPAIVILTLAVAARGDQIKDPSLRFSMTIPDGFERTQVLPPNKPNWMYGFVREEPSGDRVAIVVERMRGTLGRERLEPGDLPAGSKARLHTVRWHGFDIDAIESPEEAGGVELATFKAQVPLKPEAIQISVVGPRARRDESLALVNRLLGGLRGESNWLDSSAPRAMANSPHYGATLLVAAAAGGIGTFALLYLLSRVAPRGTLAALGGGMIATAFLNPPSHTREAMALSFAMNLAGVLGLVFGMVNYFREPKKKRKKRRARSSSNRTGPGPVR